MYPDSLIKWCETHGFEYKIVNNLFCWRTNYQTAVLDMNNAKLFWEEWKYYDTI